jgi:Tfp pilus assembly protein PilF
MDYTRKRSLTGITLSLFLTSSSALSDPITAKPIKRSGDIAGEIVSTKQGEDLVLVENNQKRPALTKQNLKAGDVLSTNGEGALAIVFADDTQLRLARNTKLIVKKVAKGIPSEINVVRGNVWARAPRGKSKLRISTPSATAAIRGTEWSLQVSDTQTDLQVASGKVEFTNTAGTLQVNGGEAANARPGQAPVSTLIVNRTDREQMLYFLPSDRHMRERQDYIGRTYKEAYLGEFDNALNILKAEEKTGTQAAELYALKSRIGLLTGNKSILKDALDLGLTHNPKNPELMGLMAEYSAHYLGQPELALIYAKEAAERAPQNAEILLTLSKIYLERRADKEAMNTIEHAISAVPDRADLYVHKADIHLYQNRPNAAQKALDKAFQIVPNISIARIGYGQIQTLKGKHGKALTEFLAASADNPAYSRAQLRLAENYGRQREKGLAEQQLDAADRLDPNSPYTPLYRTALGLDQYETEKAIAGAQEALKRFQARGGIYETLSENRETGSNLSRTFRFVDLQAMGRYYGDRVFDSFEATSYYDQVLNEEAGLFSIRQDTTSFNPANGDDVQQISSFLQGVALDPLGVANSERTLQISKEGFVEATFGGTYIASKNDNLKRGNASLQGRHYTNFGGGDLPVAYSLKGQTTVFHDDFSETTRDSSAYEAYLGTEFSASDNVAFYGTYKIEDRHISIDRTNFLQRFGGEHDFAEDQYFAVALWNHRIENRKIFSFAAGYDLKNDLDVVYSPSNNPATDNFEKLTEDFQTEVLLFSGNYAASSGKFDYKIGGDIFFKTREQINQLEIVTTNDIIVDSTRILLPNLSENQQRAYADVRYDLNAQTTLQGQLSFLNTSTETLQNGQIQSDQKNHLNYHIGIAYEPVSGHWLRASASKENFTVLPFTLSPLYSIGLKGSLIPAVDRSSVESRIARWDAVWSDKFFTAVEYQNQVFKEISYSTPDRDAVVSAFDGDINQVSFSANYLPGGSWALYGNYTYADNIGRVGQTRQTLPFVPKNTGKVGVTWTHPSRVSARLTGSYIGSSVDSLNRPLQSHLNVDAIMRWEPFNKRMELQLGVLNILSSNYESRVGVPAPGATVFTSGKIRF